MKTNVFVLVVASTLLVVGQRCPAQMQGYAPSWSYGSQMGGLPPAAYGAGYGAYPANYGGYGQPMMVGSQPMMAPTPAPDANLNASPADCGVAGCGAGCNTGCQPSCQPSCQHGCQGMCKPRWHFYGETLYLRARNAEVPLAVPIDGAITAEPNDPVQVGPITLADPDYDLGFRAGFVCNLDNYVGLRGQYTWYQSDTFNATSIDAPLVLRSLTQHPGRQAAPTDYLQGAALYDIDFQIADADLRCVFACGQQYEVAFVAGGCYVNLEQDFQAEFRDNGVEDTLTNIIFDGGGLHLGLDGEYHCCNTGFMAYGRTDARFAAGQVRANYYEVSSQDFEVVNTRWDAGRIVSIVELELGAGWQSPNGKVRLTAGYLVSAWFNAVKTDEWIEAVHTNSFLHLGDTLTFDGLVARAEVRF